MTVDSIQLTVRTATIVHQSYINTNHPTITSAGSLFGEVQTGSWQIQYQ